jgi:hypothetical protein
MRNGSHDEDRTPVADAAGAEARDQIAKLLTRLRGLEQDLSPIAGLLDQVAPADRRLFYRRLSKELRAVGDAGHEAARVVERLERERKG